MEWKKIPYYRKDIVKAMLCMGVWLSKISKKIYDENCSTYY